MKKLCSLILIVLACNYVHAQTTVTYTLDPNSEDATIDDYGPSNNYPNEIELASRAWTISSTPVTWRSLFKFNMCIPPNATVTSATLSLFYASQNNFGNAPHSSLSSSDESVLQRITSSWTENTVTWNNQPSSTTTDQVIVPQSVTGMDDYPNLDVTAMVQQMVSTQNFGFLLRLTNETAYAQMFFASGDNPASGKRPSLTVTYTVPATDCITIILDSNGEDATVDDYGPSNNYPNEIELASRAWTISSAPVTWRSFFKFDLPCGLSNIFVQSAQLSLYYPPVNGFGNDVQSSLSNSNESVLQQVTSAWTENTITWNNQPSSTTTGEVILPQSSSPIQDYTNIDVTAMAQQMFNNPGQNNGFVIKLTNEAAYAQMFFASGDNPDASKHPTLQICYSTLSVINTIKGESGLSMYPNPSADELTVSGFSYPGKKEITIYNGVGEKVYAGQTEGKEQVKVNIKNIPAGVYMLRVDGEKINWSGKFVKE